MRNGKRIGKEMKNNKVVLRVLVERDLIGIKREYEIIEPKNLNEISDDMWDTLFDEFMMEKENYIKTKPENKSP